MNNPFDNTDKSTPLKSIQEVDNLLADMWGKYSTKPYIRVEAEVAEDVQAFLALWESGTPEAIDVARQVVFEKLAVLRGPEWAKWAKSTGFGK